MPITPIIPAIAPGEVKQTRVISQRKLRPSPDQISMQLNSTGSYGACLSRFLREHGHTVVEVNRPNRQLRYQRGKSDAVDAESAVLAGHAAAQPKSGTGTVEMIRHLKIARDTVVKARTQAMQTIKAIIICSPDAPREQLDQISGKTTLLRRMAGLRPGPLVSTLASAKASLRAIARCCCCWMPRSSSTMPSSKP